MDCSKGTELGGNQFIGFPWRKLPLSNGTTKRATKKKITKLPQAEQSHRQQTPCFFAEKHKKSLRNLTHMTQSWLRMKNQQDKEKKSISTSPLASQAHVCVCSLDLKVALHRKKLNNFCRLGAKLCGVGSENFTSRNSTVVFLSAVSYQMELLN